MRCLIFWSRPLFLRLPHKLSSSSPDYVWVDISCEQDLIIAELTKGSRKICLPAAAIMSPAQENGCRGHTWSGPFLQYLLLLH